MAEKQKSKTPVQARKSPQKTKPPFRYDILLLCLLGLFTLIVFSPCFKLLFTNWDENRFIFETPMIQRLNWHNIKAIFSNKVLMSYNPLVVMSFAIDYSIVNTSPGWYHGINVFLHIINSLLLFMCIHRFTKSVAVAGIVAFIFALHPMHVESVAWVASRKDVLYGFFFMLSWLCYIRYIEFKKTLMYLLSLVLFILAMLSKVQAMVLPFVLILTDYYMTRSWNRKTFLNLLPYFAICVVLGYVAVSGSNASADLFAKPFTFTDKIMYSIIAFGYYLVKMVLPIPQSAIYPFPENGSGEFFMWIMITLAASAVLGWYGWKLFKKKPLFTLGLVFFVIAIAPTLHIVAVNSALIYERFSYISYIGLSLSLAAIMLNEKGEFRKNMAWIFILVMMVFSGISYARCGVWK